ncbi:MAG: lipoate--protein ligase [Odoribacter sp.]|nr:lipoate--protein ligase [Odoribacter sp.]
MLSLCSETHDPFFNLAVEEYLLHNPKEDFIILYTNDPCVITGKHQVVHREVNAKFIEEKNIPVIRRITGGGTVFHDRGNLNFTFIKQSETGKQVDFRRYTKPVIDFLSSMGVNAVFEGKNDLTVDGLKISGNAEHVFRERVLHHGTLLFDTSIDDLRLSLRVKTENYSTRAVESNRSSVTNLKGRLQNINTINEFIGSMQNYFLNNIVDIQTYRLGEDEKKTIRALAESKYRTWEWNYGYGPPYTFKTRFVVEGKTSQCRLVVRDGIIRECDIEGSDDMKAAGKKLIGCRHMYKDMLNKFRSENISISEEEVYKLF